MTHTDQPTSLDSPAPPPFDEKYLLDKWFDAIKLIGTGNSGAFFAAAIALYYFSVWSRTIQVLIGITAAIYFVGFMAFVLAFRQMTTYLMTYDRVYSATIPATPDPERHFKMTARRLAQASSILWLIGSFVALIVIVLISSSTPPPR